MLPLGILNASTKKVRRKKKSSTETANIFAHSQRKDSGPAPRFTLRSAPTRCSSVIARAGVGDEDDAAGSVMLRRRNDDYRLSRHRACRAQHCGRRYDLR